MVDDASTDKTADLVEEYCQKDTRVSLIRAEVNSGPYVARNLGMKKATGEFVTCHDADDWAHPQKIETQVRQLMTDPSVVSNTSNLVRVEPDLTFYRRSGSAFYMQTNMSSLMFRRTDVVEKIGYWDSVRFGGDSEYLARIKKAFGDTSVSLIETPPTTFSLHTSNSLTASPRFGYHGFKMGARLEYEENATRFHANTDRSYVEFPLRKRPFPVPEPMLPQRKVSQGKRRHFDVVLMSDFRFPGGTSSSNAEEIKAQKNYGLRSGLVQMNIYELNPFGQKNPKITDLVDGDRVESIVYGEKISCDLLIVRHPWVLEDLHDNVVDIEAGIIRVIVNQPPLRSYNAKHDRVYNIGRCAKHLEKYFGERGIWHPIGPLIRKALLDHHAAECKEISLSDDDWVNIIDVDDWMRRARPARGAQVRIGRHARDDRLKWPSSKEELLLVYTDSDKYNVRIMGGASGAVRLLGEIPKNWTVLNFNELSAREYLAELDVFVYFTHEEWVESFGRVILEAMAVGVPVILPSHYKQLFREAALYCQPREVLSLVDELMANDELYQRQVRGAREFVRYHFGYDKHIERISAGFGERGRSRANLHSS